MAKVKQSKNELKKHLKEQLTFMLRSSDAYDEGYKDEAKRLATIMRILFHDTQRSKSLLNLLGIKNNFSLFDSATDYDPDNLVAHDGLTSIRIGGGTSLYIPRLESMEELKRKGQKFFPKWWNKIVIVDKQKSKFNRRELILAITNKDGGAHIDSKIDESYANLTRKNSMGWVYTDGKITEPVEPIELASIRQISHEVIMSFRRKYPVYFT